MTTKKGSALSGILLVSGTCIGAGMLALPIVTGIAGFYPAMVVNTLCWLFMLCTGLLFMEATLWMEKGANVLSMAQRFFGPIGKFIGGGSFLFLYYCLLVAYIAGGTPLVVTEAASRLGVDLVGAEGYLIFAFGLGLIVFLGTHVVDRLNWILMAGLVLSFILLIVVGSTAVQTDFFKRSHWSLLLFAAPTLFSAYGYHNIIPSLVPYLKNNVKELRLAIILGTTIPFLAYSIWQWMIIGTLSAEEINRAVEQGVPISHTLQQITGHPWVSILGTYFGFFALVTSFLGVSLSMVDFLADGLKMQSQGYRRLVLCLVVFFPPAWFASVNPGIFIEALGIAGGFGEAILNGLFPIAMVWIGRYHLRLDTPHQLPGGRLLLTILFLFTFLIIGVEIKHLLR
jgi:tyrosine-specific transport protein